MEKERVDVLAVKQGLFETREQAKRSVMAGLIYNEKNERFDKPGEKIPVTNELKIKGKVVNMPDGSVYIEAQSTDEASLEQFIAGVESSPSPAGRVDEMDVSEMKPKEYSRFSVMYR